MIRNSAIVIFDKTIFQENVCGVNKKVLPLHPQFKRLHRPSTSCHAQMAESVDALVSNTSGATRAGSTPALGTWLKK